MRLCFCLSDKAVPVGEGAGNGQNRRLVRCMRCPLRHGVVPHEVEEVVFGVAQFGGGAGERGVGFEEVGGRVGGAADFAVVAVLVFGFAFRAGAFDEAVGQEH